MYIWVYKPHALGPTVAMHRTLMQVDYASAICDVSVSATKASLELFVMCK